MPVLKGREAEYLAECISGGFVSSVGPFVERFEREFAVLAGATRAVATTSGTAALHLALVVAGVQANDEVLVSDVTFIAPAYAVRYVGAWPVFIGPEPEYWQIDPVAVREFFVQCCERSADGLFNRATGRRVRALIAVHILGHPCDLDALAEACDEYGVTLIEDCAEAVATLYRGKPVGLRGAAAAFSFNGNKLVTSGGGGMLLSRHAEWTERARYLSAQAKDDPIEYVHHTVGYNYRLTNLQAAVGCAQLEQLPGFVRRRREIAAEYRRAFASVPELEFMREAPWAFSNGWLSTVRVKEECGIDRRALLQALAAQGIQTRPLWQPLHESPAFAGSEFFGCDFSRTLHREALSLPSSANLLPDEQARVIGAILSTLHHDQ